MRSVPASLCSTPRSKSGFHPCLISHEQEFLYLAENNIVKGNI